MRRLHLASAVGVAALLATSAAHSYTITTFGPASWSASDAALGLAGATVEDFEDTTLVAGLSVQIVAPSGSYVPTSTLPATFNPSTDDALGNAFVGETWDGVAGLLNRGGNTTGSASYNDGQWGDVSFGLAPGVTSFGFAIADLDLGGHQILVNGVSIGTLPSGNIAAGSGRGGYVRIDMESGDALIASVTIDNIGTVDGWIIDHVAFAAAAAAPEPAAVGLLGLALAGLAGLRRRVRAAGRFSR
jgi:hypothetical protein